MAATAAWFRDRNSFPWLRGVAQIQDQRVHDNSFDVDVTDRPRRLPSRPRAIMQGRIDMRPHVRRNLHSLRPPALPIGKVVLRAAVGVAHHLNAFAVRRDVMDLWDQYAGRPHAGVDAIDIIWVQQTAMLHFHTRINPWYEGGAS